MKKKSRTLIYPLAIMGVLFMLTSSCEKSRFPTGPAVFNSDKTYGTMTDQDGNEYKTITIGTQTWMAENIRTTTYRDSSPIPQETDKDKWASLSTGAYCNYKNKTSTDIIETYGRLYNWYAVSNSSNLAPVGWHIPTNDEWNTLINYLAEEGGEGEEGDMLKEIGTSHWGTENDGATNESGYTALPGGWRTSDGLFDNIKWSCYLWSAEGLLLELGYNTSSVILFGRNKNYGLSVRCLQN